MSRMAHLYERLAAVGINKRYVRAIALPAGWSDLAADANPAAYAQALSLLAQNLNLNLPALQNDAAPLVWQECGPTRFKRRADMQEESLAVARCLASRAAQVACRATTAPVPALPASASAIRNAILETGAACVGLANLLDYCWSNGVPVLHVSRFPAYAKKPDALAGVFTGRPAIVICKKSQHAAPLLFVLAHELGHIAQHVNDGDLLIDARINPADRDVEEEDANTFAMELLTGRPDVRYRTRCNLTVEELAQAAQTTGRRDGVDPGIVALQYAQSGRQGKANKSVLQIIEADANSIDLIHARMCEHLDWDALPRDRRQFLRRITQMDAAH